MRGLKGAAFIIFILVILISLPVLIPAEESGGSLPEPAGEDREIVEMLDLLELIELLKDMEVVAVLEEEK